MSNTLTVTEVINSVTVTPVNNTVTVSDIGVQGPAGATGATGATGAQGPSGVVTVNAPLTNAGTSSAANLSISAGTTSVAGALQLTDSVSSTSTTTAATPAAVKTVYDSLQNLAKRTGLYYRTPSPQEGSANIGTNNLVLTPIFVDRTLTADRIVASTHSSFVGSSTVRLGIYSNVNGAPSDLVLDAGTVSFTAGNQVREITISQSLSVGFYWFAFCQQGTPPTTSNYLGANELYTTSNNYLYGKPDMGTQTIQGFYTPSITGAFPSTLSTVTAATRVPYVYVRFA
jgi:hypothetical protein